MDDYIPVTLVLQGKALWKNMQRAPRSVYCKLQLNDSTDAVDSGGIFQGYCSPNREYTLKLRGQTLKKKKKSP